MSADKTLQIDGLKLAYLAWFRSADKDPKSRKAWAEANGVSRMTLWEWEQADWFAEVVGKDTAEEKARWEFLKIELEWLATQRVDLGAKATAIREYGKLMGKYPSEKVDHTVVTRVAYTEPGALREKALDAYPELRN
jgi:hypothetical protein